MDPEGEIATIRACGAAGEFHSSLLTAPLVMACHGVGGIRYTEEKEVPFFKNNT